MSTPIPIKILIIEDLEDDAVLLVDELQSAGFDPAWARVETEAEYLAKLQEPLDVIFSDFSLPRFSTQRALKLLLESKRSIPFIIVSGTIGEERAVESLKSGATDYVLKDRLGRLGPVVQRALRESQERRELKDAEEQLRTAHQQMRHLLAHSPAVIYHLKIFGEQFLPLAVSDNITRLLGFDVAETLRYNWWLDQLHPDDRERAIASAAETISQGSSRTEYRLRDKNGTYRWLEDNRRLIRDGSNQPSELVGALVDITERKQTEAALQESELKFRQLAENAGEVFWISNLNSSQILYVSPAYEKIWGRSCAKLYLSPSEWSDAIHGEDRERVLHAATTRQATGGYDEEYRITRPDGAIRWIRDRAFPVRDETGQVVRIVGVADDITERKSLEEQFRQSQKMEAIGQLAGGVAHDFNNLLTVIQCYTNFVLESKNLLEKEREELQEVFTASQRAAGLTRQLLTFSRKQLIQFKSININQTINNLGKMLHRVIGEDIHLQFECSSTLPSVLADAGMLEQVVMNLSVNARDAMPKGGTLTIGTFLAIFETSAPEYRERRPGSFIQLKVQDTGCGMTPETMQRIFEPFFTTKGVGKGTGLGLATVYGIAKQHRGWIEVESEPGKGTTFNVYFPVTTTAPTAGKTVLGESNLQGTETILLVEDDLAIRNLGRVVLQRQGYQVLDASSGESALEVWKNNSSSVDLLLTDLVLPGGINGVELGKKLAAKKPGLKIIYTSGYSDFHERMGGYILKEDINFVQKPFHPNDLLKLIRQVLDSAVS